MKTSILIIAIVVFSTLREAHAKDEEHVIAGAGAGSCGQWLEARAVQSKNLDRMLVAWVQGFLSGMNTQKYWGSPEHMAAIPDAPTLLAYVDKFCRDNPLESSYLASLRLFDEMQEAK